MRVGRPRDYDKIEQSGDEVQPIPSLVSTCVACRNHHRFMEADQPIPAGPVITHDTIIRSLADGILAVDTENRVCFMNPAAEKLTGWEFEKAKALPLEQILPMEAEGSADSQAVAGVLQSGQPAMFRGLLRLDGHAVPVDAHVTPILAPIFGAAESIAGATVTLRELAEARRAELTPLGIEERYRSAFEFSSVGMALVGTDGRWLRVNRALCNIVGYNEGELLCRTFQDITHPDDLAGDLNFASQVLAGNISIFKMEKRYIQKAGTIVWVLLSVSLVRDEAGQPRYFVSQIEDITERKEAERKLERTNRLYAVLSRCGAAIIRARSEDELFREVCSVAVESGGFSIAWFGTVDPATMRIVPVAKAGAAADYFDSVTISVDGPLSMGPTGVCFREARPVTSADFATDPAMEPWRKETAQYGLRSAISIPVLCRGQMVNAFGLLSSEPGFFREEETALVTEIGASISFALDRMALDRERLQAEGDLKENRERLELVLEAAGEAYWDWKMDENQWYTSPRFHTMLGFDPGEIEPGLNATLEMTHPDDRPVVLRSLAGALYEGKDALSVEFRMRHKNGTYRWVLGRSKVVARDAAGNVARAVGTRVDITEHKQLAERFLQAQKMESIGRLAGGVAHDFNNLLTVINGYASLLRSKVPAEGRLADGLKSIGDAGERAAALTRQLLAFSRKQVPRPEPVNLSKLIRGMERIIHRLLGEGIELHLSLAPDLSAIRADPTQIEQVVMNLAVNARDAVDHGGSVTIETAQIDLQGDRQGPHVRLTIADNGSGMSAEVMPHIFEPFYTTKEQGHGTGLGLSTVYGIVEDSRGFIQVDSELGKGSSFQVYFPAIAELAVGNQPDEILLPGLDNNETVLVVEDQLEVRHFTTSVLESYGYRVLEASNGEEALEVAAAHAGPIEVAVTDVIMPGISSRELTGRLLAARPDIKILYVSGYPANTSVERDLMRPGASYLAKPYSPEVLVSKLRELLSGAG